MNPNHTTLYNVFPTWPTDIGRLHKTEVMP